MSFDEYSEQVNKRFDMICNCVNDTNRLLRGEGEDTCLLRFLYAFMPASDRLTYDASLFMQFVQHGIFLRENYDWCGSLPDEIFFNYVLHYRVNNENIEFCRSIFHDELSERIKGLSAEEAVLEVNYWCLEKVTYRSTNSRTVSPLTAVKSAYGRCGEESVFAVSALRSVGIPARQCYTPRWAHCDDNHAWVEVYVDGMWRYMGACEPEEALDRGWFSYPATKAMLVHTRQFSTLPVTAPDELLCVKNGVTEINVTSRYAKTVLLTVKVHNAPEGTVVRFELCNVGELFPLAELPLDNGTASVTLGKGSVHLHITDRRKYISELLDLSECGGEYVKILDFESSVDFETESKAMIFSPPKGHAVNPVPGSEEKNKKTESANLIRANFETGFLNSETGSSFAKNLTCDESVCREIVTVLAESKANYPEIMSFLNTSGDLDLKCSLLLSLEPKDLADITAEVLLDHLSFSKPYKNQFERDIFVKYVMCPRIADEMVYGFRHFIQSYFSEAEREAFKLRPSDIFMFITENINDITGEDYAALYGSHVGALTHKQGSKSSRNLLFAAVCRTLGIPARLNAYNRRPEYYSNGLWVDAQTGTPIKLAKVNLFSGSALRFYENYTIAKLESGVYETLSLPFGYNEEFVLLEAGRYRLLSCARSPMGGLSVNCIFFEVSGEDSLQVSVDIPAVTETSSLADIGGIAVNGHHLTDIVSENSLCCFIKPGNEPTEHLLNELLDNGNYRTPVIFIMPDDRLSVMNPLLTKILTDFPCAKLITAEDLSFEDSLFRAVGASGNGYPVVFAFNAKKDVTYLSSGYNVGAVKLAIASIS